VNRRAVIGIAAAALVTLLVVLGVREAGSVVRRPEGAAERFLTAASRRSEKDRAKVKNFGDPALAHVFTDFPRKDTDDDFLTRIEVGRASGRHGTVRVPYRVRRNDRRESKVVGVLVVAEQAGKEPRRWRVVGLEPCCEGVAVPKRGSAPASVGVRVWLLALALGAVFTLGSEALLRALGATPRQRR
jgi:hypothetical protein